MDTEKFFFQGKTQTQGTVLNTGDGSTQGTVSVKTEKKGRKK